MWWSSSMRGYCPRPPFGGLGGFRTKYLRPRDPRRAIRRQYPRPDAMAGVLADPSVIRLYTVMALRATLVSQK